MLASRAVTSKMSMVEPPLASYLNSLSLVGFPWLTLKRPRLMGRVSIVARYSREGGLPSASITCRDLVRAVRRSVLVALRFLFEVRRSNSEDDRSLLTA
jgi:hypothetical protein